MRRFFDAIRSEKRMVAACALLFIMFSLVGFVASEPIGTWMKQTGVWEQFQRKAESINQDPGLLNTYGVIFFNNLLAAAGMIGLGIFFGIYPALGVIFNGLLLGVVVGSVSDQADLHPVTLVVTHILPHGILELPAVIFAAAFGMRLGALAVGCLTGLASPELRERYGSAWKDYLSKIPVLFTGVVVMLAVAALIESSLIVFYT